MKIKKTHTLTLALEGESIRLEEFKQAVTSFLELVESVSEEATGTGQRIQWDVSVKSGSALVSVIPRDSIDTRAAIQEVIAAIPDGIVSLNHGIPEIPRLFGSPAIRAMKRLAVLRAASESSLARVRLLVNRKKKTITRRIAT